MSKFWNWIKSHLFDGFLFAFLWELLEELLEMGIAFFVTWAILQMAAKVFAVTLFTQGIKTVGKKFLFPIILKLTYREGHDKMNALRKYWTKVWGNKITGTIGGAGFAITAYYVFAGVITNTWLYSLAVFAAFVIAYNIAVFFGGETLAQIEKRLDDAKLTDYQKKVKATAKKRLADVAKAATLSIEQRVKDEEKRKKEETFEKDVEQAMKELANKETENK